MMRKRIALIVLIIAAAVFLIFTEPGERILAAFGVRASDCIKGDVLNTLGFHVPQCTCGDGSAPPPQI
jgi:small neutral amino acid transporter SnatA (MarC family)